MKKNIKAFIAVIFTFLLCLNLFIASSSAQNPPQTLVGVTERVSVASDGAQGNMGSWSTSISADGRYVAFDSVADNLVVGDTNGYNDIFVHDRVTGETTRVSVASDGIQGNYYSINPSISANGRYVAFDSNASTLVLGDTNGCSDVFEHDRVTGETTRISVASDGTQGNESSFYPSVSADGRYVAFESASSNLVVGDTNDYVDVFVHDRVTGETTLISVATDGTQGIGGSYRPFISADGGNIAFVSGASNLVVGDTNGTEDIFVHDQESGETTRVSVASNGLQGNSSSGYLFSNPDIFRPSISADGRFVAFQSQASNLVDGDSAMCWGWELKHPIYYNCSDIFVHDRQTGGTTRVSVASDGTQGNFDTYLQSISADGHFVEFESWASNLVAGDTNYANDIFVHDQLTGETTRVSVSNDGIQGNFDSGGSSISADGRYVAFGSSATNLVVGDTNGTADAFVRDREGLVTGYSVSGHVTDLGGNPLPGVNISAGYGYSAITDSQGDYSISGLPSGTYWVTASLTDSFFIPFRRTVSVPPERVGINFTEGFPAFLPLMGR
jgi:Tol biopolymer transport system component